jgi:bifunctional non-homologous end joining protein LigD
MPYLLHRPISMVRCPEGVAGVSPESHEDQPGPCFFHKHAGRDFPGTFERVKIRESGGPRTYLTITEPGSLIALAQMGVLEIHLWGSRWPDIEHPDMVVFDLDPDPEVGWQGAVEGARLVRTLLQGLELESFVKTTGGKGLHVVLPLRPQADWQLVKPFAKAVAEGIVRYAPDRFTSSMSKAKRGGKTFVDYLRNSRGATSVAPYSTRAKPGATVSVPLRWEELGRQEGPADYSLENLSRRLVRLKGDPWEGYFELERSQALTDSVIGRLGL